MKKHWSSTIALVLAFLMLIAFVGCGESEPIGENNPGETTQVDGKELDEAIIPLLSSLGMEDLEEFYESIFYDMNHHKTVGGKDFFRRWYSPSVVLGNTGRSNWNNNFNGTTLTLYYDFSNLDEDTIKKMESIMKWAESYFNYLNMGIKLDIDSKVGGSYDESYNFISFKPHSKTNNEADNDASTYAYCAYNNSWLGDYQKGSTKAFDVCMTKADIVLKESSIGKSTLSVESVFMHEILHAIGIEHANNNEIGKDQFYFSDKSLMYKDPLVSGKSIKYEVNNPSNQKTSETHAGLYTIDYNAVRKLYAMKY